MAVLGALIERGGDHLDPLRLFVPGIDVKAEFAKRADAGVPDDLRVEDLYPDAVPALRALIAAGYRVGIVGNQPARAEAVFNGLGLALDFVASSASWGLAKPDPAFFARIAEELRLPPERDRLRRRPPRQRRPSGRGRRDGRDLHPPRGLGLDPGRPVRSARGGCVDREPERAAGRARGLRVTPLGRNPLPGRRAVRPDRQVRCPSRHEPGTLVSGCTSRSIDRWAPTGGCAPRDGLSRPVKGTGVGKRQTFPRDRGRRLRSGRGPCRGRAASRPPGPPSRRLAPGPRPRRPRRAGRAARRGRGSPR